MLLLLRDWETAFASSRTIYIFRHPSCGKFYPEPQDKTPVYFLRDKIPWSESFSSCHSGLGITQSYQLLGKTKLIANSLKQSSPWLNKVAAPETLLNEQMAAPNTAENPNFSVSHPWTFLRRTITLSKYSDSSDLDFLPGDTSLICSVQLVVFEAILQIYGMPEEFSMDDLREKW